MLHYTLILLFFPEDEFERPVVVDFCVGKRGDVPVCFLPTALPELSLHPGFCDRISCIFIYIFFCMYAVSIVQEKIDLIFICTLLQIFVSILYFLLWFSVKQEYYVNIVL